MKRLEILLSISFAAYIYILLSVTRMTIEGADLTVVTGEFSTLEMSDYNWREPLYWLVGKTLTALTSDPWFAISILDIMAALMLLFSFDKKNLKGVLIISLLFSPMIVLGICNIHRQLIAFSVWIFIERRLSSQKIGYKFIYHVIPFLIHSSLGLISIIYFVAKSYSDRNFKAVFLVAGALILFITVFNQFALSLFREGADTNTSALVYLGWAACVLSVAVISRGMNSSFYMFYVIGCLIGIVLFSISAPTSGSRFMMLIITISAVWLFLSDELNNGSTKARFLTLSLSALMIGPTFTSNFSKEIIRASISGTPYEADY